MSYLCLLHHWFIMSSSIQMLEYEPLKHLLPVYCHVSLSLCYVSGCTPMVFNITSNVMYVRIIHIPWALFWISFYSSPVYLIWHFCSGRLPYVVCDIFSQCVVYEKLFNTLQKKKKVQNCQIKIFCCSCCSFGLAYCGWHLGAGLLLSIKRCAFYKWEHCSMTIHWKIQMKIEYLYFYREISTWYQQQSSYLAGLTLFSLPLSGIAIPCPSLGFCVGKRNVYK